MLFNRLLAELREERLTPFTLCVGSTASRVLCVGPAAWYLYYGNLYIFVYKWQPRGLFQVQERLYLYSLGHRITTSTRLNGGQTTTDGQL